MTKGVLRAAMTIVHDTVAPDVALLLRAGVEYRRLRGLSVRPEALRTVEEFERIVWAMLDVGDTGSEDDSEAADDSDLEREADDLFVTPVDLARRAGADPSYVRRLCRRGVLTSRKVHGRHFIERDAAEAWLARQTTRCF